MAPKRKAGESEKTTMPAGKKDSLYGLKLLFTGTFSSLDRKTCEATAKKYGATLVTPAKISEVDMVVLGAKAGQKKLDEIENFGLKTIDEDEFLEMIQTGDAAKDPEDVDGGDEDEVDEEEDVEEPPPKKTKKAAPIEKAAPKKKAAKAEKVTTIPEGKENAFKGLKLLFTGTFEIDRKTCEATAKTYGASLAKKLEDADYIVLGTKPGPKKLEQIENEGLTTMNEHEFFNMLKSGEAP